MHLETRPCSPVLRGLAWAMTLGFLVIGCDGEVPPTDATIIISDGGPPPEPDAGEIDAGDGTCGDAISVGGWAPMPSTCLPRCSAETLAAVRACDSAADPGACFLEAVAADDTPAVSVGTGSGPFTVSCGGSAGAATAVYPCWLWQMFSCQSDACPLEYGTWVTCRAEGGACAAEQGALESCSMTSAEFDTCARERSPLCYVQP